MKSRLLFAALALCLTGTAVFAHFAIKKSLPAKDARISTTLEAVQVWFTQEPEMEKSALVLTGPQGPVALGAVEAGQDFSLRARVTSTLAPGAYVVEWKTAGDDGHVLSGKIPFSVVPPSPKR